MTKKFLTAFAVLALAVASAASSYRVTLFQASEIGGKQLKAGDYKMHIEGEKVTLAAGKEMIETTGKVETSSEKYSTTTVRYGGDSRVQEIRIGGTNTKVVFN